VKGARANNLKDVTAAIPLGTFTCITGVSGSGKSSFTIDTLYAGAARALNGARVVCGPCEKISGLEYLDKVIDIDQSPIGRTPALQSRHLYRRLHPDPRLVRRPAREPGPRLQARPLLVQRQGRPLRGVLGRRPPQDRDALPPDVYVTCDVCHGQRYNRETLEVKFKGRSIADVLDMTVEDAVEFFKAVPPIREKMAMLAEVGLGYIKVGQQATTLSGGEAQRVKLAKELSRRATGQTLYILDEPTTGLHFEDVEKLLESSTPSSTGQQRRRHRAQPRSHQDRRLGDRPRPRRRRQGRRDRRRRHARAGRQGAPLLHRPLPRPAPNLSRSCRAKSRHERSREGGGQEAEEAADGCGAGAEAAE
jgi:excinuclease ABC subunit A